MTILVMTNKMTQVHSTLLISIQYMQSRSETCGQMERKEYDRSCSWLTRMTPTRTDQLAKGAQPLRHAASQHQIRSLCLPA